MSRFPCQAVPALRARVEGFLRSHGLLDGRARLDVDVHGLNLAEFLLAALRYTREAYPWVDREEEMLVQGRRGEGKLGKVPQVNLADAALTLWQALDSGVPSVDMCMAALWRVVPFEVSVGECGRRRPKPQCYRWVLAGEEEGRGVTDGWLEERVFGVVAEEGWLEEMAGRDEVFREVLPPSESSVAFVEIEAGAAVALVQALFAGAGGVGRGRGRASREQVEALVGLFGERTRAFAPRGMVLAATGELSEGEARRRAAQETGRGEWGSAACVVVSDGRRVAFVESSPTSRAGAGW
ncbi:hypothetical protein [Chondromyces apiculatus]|nr:hypothetical protein [Chondromyces apiculatus]